MKNTLALACILSALAIPSFAQYAPTESPAEMGAKLVAERDAAWRRNHVGNTEVQEPMATNHARRVGPVKHVKNAKHVKRVKQPKHVKHAKHAKRHVTKRAPSNVSPATPQ